MDTTEWPDWVRVTTYFGNYTNNVPDKKWGIGGGYFQGLSHENGIVSVPRINDVVRTRVVITHEATHATNNNLKRTGFGDALDHSPENTGLMDPSASVRHFNDTEIKILKGVQP